jgi:hypothetical protein
MKNMAKLFGVTALVAVIGFSIIACNNGSTGGGGGGNTGGNQGDQTGTQRQLAFELINNGTAYRVRKGTVNSGNVVIPAYWNGTTGRASRAAGDDLPVTEIGKADDKEGNGAFEGTDITDITIPETVELIGPNAFRRNKRLTRLVIPEGVTEIGGEALWDCENVTSITIPVSVTKISPGAFSGAGRLTSITVAPGNPNYSSEGGILYSNILIYGSKGMAPGMGGTIVEVVQETVYADDNKKTVLHSYPSASGSVTISSIVTHIGEDAFCVTDITDVTMQEGVKSIGRAAFMYCINLTSINIPASCLEIHFEAGQDVFQDCTNLTNITVAPGNSEFRFRGEDGMLFFETPTVVLKAYPSARGNVIIPDNVDNISTNAFYQNKNITNITLPQKVGTIYESAFADCTNITSIIIPTTSVMMGSSVFSGWTSSQTINVPFANQAAADVAWGADWRKGCNANIVYEP